MVPWEELCAGATVEIDCGCSDVSGRPGDFVRGVIVQGATTASHGTTVNQDKRSKRNISVKGVADPTRVMTLGKLEGSLGPLQVGACSPASGRQQRWDCCACQRLAQGGEAVCGGSWPTI
jgi:hypothetical protein